MNWTILWPTNLFFQFLLIPSFSAVFEEILKNSSFYLDPFEQNHCTVQWLLARQIASHLLLRLVDISIGGTSP